MCVYVRVYIHTHTHTHTGIQREREREREMQTDTYVCQAPIQGGGAEQAFERVLFQRGCRGL